MDAVIRVYTFKEGLLSKLAHDLLLDLGRFEIEAQGDAVHAVLEPASLEIVGALSHGKLVPGWPSSGDRAKILQNLAEDVLHTRRFPKVLWSGKAQRGTTTVQLDGTLELCGVRQSLPLTLRREAGRLRGELEFAPSRFGVKPYRALGGTLKVQDRVRLTIDAEDPGEREGEALRWTPRT